VNDREKERQASLDFLARQAPDVFDRVASTLDRLTDGDIEQLVRYTRWLEEHQGQYRIKRGLLF